VIVTLSAVKIGLIETGTGERVIFVGWGVVPKRAPFTVLGVVVFRIYPPLEFPFSATPLPKGVRRTLHTECFQCSVRVDLKVDEGGGGSFFAKRGGAAAGPAGLSAQQRGVLLPVEADRAATSGALAVTCHVGQPGGGRYTSREVLLNPVDEAGHRGLERLDILTLIFL
jgi:hypothetical protein